MEVKQAINVLELLEFFAQRQQPATLADVCRHLGWPRSSAFNLLSTLAARGYLYEPVARQGWYPSPQWGAVLAPIEQAAPLPENLHALLHELAAQTQETAVIAGISGVHAVFLASVESPQAVRYAAPVGKRVPLHASATGRALLSQLPAADRAVLLRKAAFDAFTPTTLRSAAAVEAAIARSLQRGWFESAGEFTPDLGGVAMPLAEPGRHLALLVGGPITRVQPRYAELARAMTASLDRIRLAR